MGTTNVGPADGFQYTAFQTYFKIYQKHYCNEIAFAMAIVHTSDERLAEINKKRNGLQEWQDFRKEHRFVLECNCTTADTQD